MTMKKKKGVAEETGEYIKKIYHLRNKKTNAIINQIEKINLIICPKLYYLLKLLFLNLIFFWIICPFY